MVVELSFAGQVGIEHKREVGSLSTGQGQIYEKILRIGTGMIWLGREGNEQTHLPGIEVVCVLQGGRQLKQKELEAL